MRAVFAGFAGRVDGAAVGAVDLRRAAPASSWNVAPTASVTVAAWDCERERRVLLPMTWGLLAPWEKHWDTAKLPPINARCKTVATSKTFAGAFRQRRGLVVVDGWYEWAKRDGQNPPHAQARADGTPMVLGGIWECWRSPIGDRMLTLAIVTTPASLDLVGIHDRMPLVLEGSDWPVWLGEAEGLEREAGQPVVLMRPARSGSIVTWRVVRAVGDPRNNGAELLAAEPAAAHAAEGVTQPA